MRRWSAGLALSRIFARLIRRLRSKADIWLDVGRAPEAKAQGRSPQLLNARALGTHKLRLRAISEVRLAPFALMKALVCG